MINLNEAIQKIKQAGSKNVRAVPAPGANYNGEYRIEICEGGVWSPVASGFNKKMADDIITQALNRTILG